jgi:hypothetical protein
MFFGGWWPTLTGWWCEMGKITLSPQAFAKILAALQAAGEVAREIKDEDLELQLTSAEAVLESGHLFAQAHARVLGGQA